MGRYSQCFGVGQQGAGHRFTGIGTGQTIQDFNDSDGMTKTKGSHNLPHLTLERGPVTCIQAADPAHAAATSLRNPG